MIDLSAGLKCHNSNKYGDEQEYVECTGDNDKSCLVEMRTFDNKWKVGKELHQKCSREAQEDMACYSDDKGSGMNEYFSSVCFCKSDG